MRPFLFLLIGLFIGYSMSLIFRTTTPTPVVAVAQPATNTLKATVAMSEVYYQDVVDSLQNSNESLSEKVDATRSELKQAKAHGAFLAALVDTLLTNYSTTNDTGQKLTYCDSLSLLVEDVLYTSSVKDSLYDSILVAQHQELMNKDQIILAGELKYDGLKFSFDQSIAQQDMLLDNNILLDKRLKHSRTKSKILSALVVILAGVTSAIALNH